MQARTPLKGDIATLVQRLVVGKRRYDPPKLAPVIGGVWGDVKLDGLWGPLTTEGRSLVWEATTRRGAPDVVEKLRALAELNNARATLELADGTRVVAGKGSPVMRPRTPGAGPGVTGDFIYWHTEGDDRVARWVGQLRGGGCWNMNLSVLSSEGAHHHNLRLVGNYVWYILDTDRAKDEFTVVIDTNSPAFDLSALGIDLNALQVAFGAPLRLDELTGLDQYGYVVGAAGVHLGGWRETSKSRRADGAVPDDPGAACWLPVFFNRLATSMQQHDEFPWGPACTAYLDSVVTESIDGQYVKLHIALEAFARVLLEPDGASEPGALVKDYNAWKKWVDSQRDVVREMLVETRNEEMLVTKLKRSMKPKSSGLVGNALSRLEPNLVLDDAFFNELNGRDFPVHNFSMNEPDVDYDVERDQKRVHMLQTAIVALLARASGYDGPISGWEWSDKTMSRASPTWWPTPSAETITQAMTLYECGTKPRTTSSRPPSSPRLRSRISTRPSRR